MQPLSGAFIAPYCTAPKLSGSGRRPPSRTSFAAAVVATLICVQGPVSASPTSYKENSLENTSIKESMAAASSILALSRSERSLSDSETIELVVPRALRQENRLKKDNVVLPHLSLLRSADIELEMLTRMSYAVMCGAIIGVERRAASATAGVRTLSLVSLGSAIFTLTAVFGLGGAGSGRMGAAVSTGVGFLGAGAINRSGNGNRNLTTSASIWIAASLGMAAASGMYRLAFKGAIFTVFILRWSTLVRYLRFTLKKNGKRMLAFLQQSKRGPIFPSQRSNRDSAEG